MNNHTELPWSVGYGGGLSGPRAAPTCYLDAANIAQIPIRKAKKAVAWLLCSGDDPLLENDAAFIVKAVNNHYQLLEALKTVTEELHLLCEDERDDPSVGITGWDDINGRIIHDALEAIKQAEEQ